MTNGHSLTQLRRLERRERDQVFVSSEPTTSDHLTYPWQIRESWINPFRQFEKNINPLLTSASGKVPLRLFFSLLHILIAISMLPVPINFPKWLEENGHLLQPPVGNFCLYKTDDYTVMAVGGPNARSDYHFQPTEEFFYQYKGAMLLKVIDDGKFRDIHIGEGEMFMLPANTPHSPCRFENTVGLVVERTRPQGKEDAMRWYCPNLSAHQGQPYLVKERRFVCTDLGTQLKPIIDSWKADKQGRKCAGCGYEQEERELIGDVKPKSAATAS